MQAKQIGDLLVFLLINNHKRHFMIKEKYPLIIQKLGVEIPLLLQCPWGKAYPPKRKEKKQKKEGPRVHMLLASETLSNLKILPFTDKGCE